MATVTKKQTRASKKKNPSHETHGALPAAPQMNMKKLFGINDGYEDDSLEDYSMRLEKMLTSELHEHAHQVGIIPLDQKDKLIASLRRKFQETKLANIGPKVVQIKTNPAMADFHKKWFAGELGR